jgi:hypothetical protein
VQGRHPRGLATPGPENTSPLMTGIPMLEAVLEAKLRTFEPTAAGLADCEAGLAKARKQ